MFLFAGILQTLETSCKMSRFPNEEKVPGSSPGRPAHKYVTYRQKIEERRRPVFASGALLYYQYTYADLVG